MKKHLKLISLLSLFIISTSMFFIFAKRPADDKPETVMVRASKYHLTKGDIAILYSGNKIEVSNPKESEFEQSVLSIIQKLNSEGYKVISQSQCMYGPTQNETWVLTLK